MPTKPTVHSTDPPAHPPTEDRQAVLDRAHKGMPPAPAKQTFMQQAKAKAVQLSYQATHQREINIVGAHQLNAFAEVFSAHYTGLELAVACTVTQMESAGRMIYGSDPASGWMNTGPFGHLWGEPVTKANATWAWSQIQKGSVSNGFGMKQLTSPGLIADANAHGGVWHPQHNAATGDRFMLSLIKQSGSLWAAFYHYNGSGAAAERYANNCAALVQTWRARLA